MPFPKTESELAAAGYKFLNSAKCGADGCGAEIAWYRTPGGKHIPLDEGTLEAHWATCANPEQFRKQQPEKRRSSGTGSRKA